MIAEVTRRGRATDVVRVRNVALETVSDDDVLNAALAAAGETRSRLFGWRITRSLEDHVATVELWKD